MNGYFWTVKLSMRWYPHQIERWLYQQISHPQHCSTFDCGRPRSLGPKLNYLLKFKCSRTSRGVPVMPDIMAAVKCCCYTVKVDVFFNKHY